jgi:hypothetical protein
MPSLRDPLNGLFGRNAKPTCPDHGKAEQEVDVDPRSIDVIIGQIPQYRKCAVVDSDGSDAW